MDRWAGCLAALLVTVGCGSSTDSALDDQEPQGDAAATSVGGQTGAGGSKAAGGDSGTAGRSSGTGGKAGSAGTGGKAGSGGNVGSGGQAGSGGNVGSGGSAGAGGNVGTGGAPQTVLACDSLAPVGTWEKVTPSGVTFTQDFVLDPLHTGTVYVGAAAFLGSKGGIYKTTDCGATWQHVSTGVLGQDIDAAGHWTLAIDFVDPQILYTANGYGTSGVFKSTNGGVDWTQMLPADIAKAFTNGGFVERIAMDPTNRLHLTVTPHFVCEAPHTSSCMLETSDGGTTWRVIENTPPGGEDTGQMMMDSKHWLYAASDWALYQTLDGGASWSKVFTGWTTDQDLYRASDGAYYLAAEAGGVVRSADGLTWAAVPNSPQSIRAVIGDGTTLFTSNRRDCTNCQPYMSAPESNLTTFSVYPSPPLPRGGWRLHYDTSHHLLYSSTETNGLWRVRTR